MERAPLGSLGWKVSRIGLGTMPLAVQGRPAEADAVSLIHRALDAGMNWLDTADTYCLDDAEIGYGERLIARALREWSQGDRDVVLVTTKGGWIRPRGEWEIDGHPARLKLACERSLKALGVSSIFLYQLHAPDPKVDFTDSVGALVDLQREGKIQHIGLSNVDVGHIKEAQTIAVVRTVQNRCNLFDQFSFTNGVVDYCGREGIAFIAHSAVGGHRGHTRAGESSVLQAMARRLHRTPHQVVLLWLLAKAPHLFGIPGARRVESLTSNVEALTTPLSPSDMAELSQAFPSAGLLRPAFVRARNELSRVQRSLRRRFSGATSRQT